MTGAIFCETRPAMIIKSAWRGDGRNTSEPNRATSKRDAAIDIISIAQQASPNPSGQMELLRAQFTALSSCAKIIPSSCSSLPKSSGFSRVTFLPADALMGPRPSPTFSHTRRLRATFDRNELMRRKICENQAGEPVDTRERAPYPTFRRFSMDLFEEVVKLRRAGKRGALATIVHTNGSIPSYESSRMLVREDGSIAGTIGGGCVEAEVWAAAKEVMQAEQPRKMTFNLNHEAGYDSGLICGGTLEVFVEPILPQPVLYIFGGGHVSIALAEAAHAAGFDIGLVDDREAFANAARFPMAREIYTSYEE